MLNYQKEIAIRASKDFQFQRRGNKNNWKDLQSVIYNKSTDQILGRTPKNWVKLLIFYTIFYAVLVAFFAICMKGLFASLDERAPKWKLEESLIGINPGLGFRPTAHDVNDRSVIRYHISNCTTIRKWVGLINEFLEPYHKNHTGEPFVECGFNMTPKTDKVCAIPTEQFGNCNPQRLYGYNTSSPCIFIKLNRIYGWVPKYYSAPVEGMPEDLVIHILNTPQNDREQIWVSCSGLDDFDRGNIKGFKYSPHGFASYYYPYRNAPHYLSPLVAVEIVHVTPNVTVKIECRAWAENIEYRGSLNKVGSVTFEIQVDANIE